ncbi:MAG: precorrin-6y C5,15-methyltransferase (decarboxylating) subunit CbiE [Mariprofundales bacterium]|nr:precorrin-6y C5,15-methyltransferase (decarboxylating) subunit CbiE [Mariprofundales bacterium]
MKKCVVLGVLDSGAAGLTAEQLAIVQQADVVIGGSRLLSLLTHLVKDGAQCRDLTGKLSEVVHWIEQALSAAQAVVVLATGDPLCHGIGSYLIERVGLSKLEIIPNVSSLQLACARCGVSWHDAYICSIHGRDSGEWGAAAGRDHLLYPLFRACMQHRKIIVFTSPKNSPDRIARMLVAEGVADEFEMVVVESLLQAEEHTVAGRAVAELAEQSFAELNMVILERKAVVDRGVLFGLDDLEFNQRRPDRGLITKREVRAVSLAHLQLKVDSIVWDIGAGSGSVGLEAARICSDGWVYAVEKNVADVEIAGGNQSRMGVHNYTLLHAKAPQGLEDWPDPDAVFVGGSGGELPALIQQIASRLRVGGHLVMNFVTLENLATATECLKRLALVWSVTQMQVSRSKPILHMHRMAAENPVWIVTVKRADDANVEGHRANT